MLTTLELRWFFPSMPCSRELFFPPSLAPEEERTDYYAFPCNAQWGVKVRSGKLEVKLLKTDYGPKSYRHVQGRLEQWVKWSMDRS